MPKNERERKRSIELCQKFKEMERRFCAYQDDTMKLQAVDILHGSYMLGALHHHLRQDNANLLNVWFSGFNLINKDLGQKQKVWHSINYLMIFGTTKANG